MSGSVDVRLAGQVTEPTEADLVAQARRGDPQAWEALVGEHQEHIFRLAYLVLRDAAEAEDVAQETFIRAFLALDQFDTSRPLRPWLTRIAINQARNRRRALGRYLNHLRQLVVKNPQPVKNVSGPERIVHKRRQADWLWQTVQQLNQIGQEVIYLRYFLDMSEAEMAEALDVAPGTVKSRLYRALKKLRQIVEDDVPALHEPFGIE
jgi:RNA polymerase sigma-70 factor (ECF subfamily)